MYRIVITCFGPKKPTPLFLASAETTPQAFSNDNVGGLSPPSKAIRS
jgi:hypothetical protein